MAKIEERETVATNDAYTGMLAISLIALIAGCALLFLDYSQYPDKDAPKVKAPVPKMEAPAPPQGGGQVAPGGQQPPMNQPPMNQPPMGVQKGG